MSVGGGALRPRLGGGIRECWLRGGPHTCEGEGERKRERETMMSAFPSGLVTWSLPGKQTGNRLHKGSLLGEAAGDGFTLSSLLCPQRAGFPL